MWCVSTPRHELTVWCMVEQSLFKEQQVIAESYLYILLLLLEMSKWNK